VYFDLKLLDMEVISAYFSAKYAPGLKMRICAEDHQREAAETGSVRRAAP